MTATINVSLKGLDSLIAFVSSHEAVGEPLRRFFVRAGITIQNRARINVAAQSSSSGRLAGSMYYEVDDSEIPLYAKVGTNVEYAPYMEFGTGALGDPDAPYSHKSSHYPPPTALATWARLHGLNPYAVAKAIAKRGGLKARSFLRKAFEDSKEDIQKELDATGREIKDLWNRAGA